MLEKRAKEVVDELGGIGRSFMRHTRFNKLNSLNPNINCVYRTRGFALNEMKSLGFPKIQFWYAAIFFFHSYQLDGEPSTVVSRCSHIRVEKSIVIAVYSKRRKSVYTIVYTRSVQTQIKYRYPFSHVRATIVHAA